MTKPKMSPCLPEEKSWKKPFWSLTVNEGDFSLLNGDRPDELAALLAQLHAPADHLRHREAGAQLIEELGREAHGCGYVAESVADRRS